MKRHALQFAAAAMLGLAVFAAPQALAGQSHDDGDERIVIRRTVPYPQAVRRAPLTSDQLSTTSTRLIDARRGFRPFDTVHRESSRYRRPLFVGHDDHFGITRPENRPYSYSQRVLGRGVTQHVNPAIARRVQTVETRRATPSVVIINDERGLAERPRADRRDAPDMRVRIHTDKPELPSRSGAVIIMADGTVIQVGD